MTIPEYDECACGKRGNHTECTTKIPSKTHLEKFVELYRDFGVELVVSPSKEGFCICMCYTKHPGNADGITYSKKFEGYTRFFSEVVFDHNGNFIRQGFWE